MAQCPWIVGTTNDFFLLEHVQRNFLGASAKVKLKIIDVKKVLFCILFVYTVYKM